MNRMRGKSIVMVFLMIGVMMLAGCQSRFGTEEDEDTLTPLDESLVVVGVSQIGSESVWRTANSASIQREFTKENGYFLIFDNARQKQENQIKAIRSFISQQVDYIIFSPITESGWDTVLQEAKDAHIPVILMDRKVRVEDESLYTTWIGSDFLEEGRKAGEWLEQYLKKKGKEKQEMNLVVLQGTEGATSVIGRTQGFNEIAKKHDTWKILDEVDAEYTTAKAREVMGNLLRKHKKIDVVVSQNDDMTFGAIEAIEAAGFTTGEDGDIVIISFDAVRSALELVQEGKINVDIECNPVQGEKIRHVLRRLEKGEKVEREYYVQEQVFTKETVGNLDERTY